MPAPDSHWEPVVRFEENVQPCDLCGEWPERYGIYVDGVFQTFYFCNRCLKQITRGWAAQV